MVKRVQIIRHNQSGANAFVGREGELTVDITDKELRVHDGIQTGGFGTARKDLANVAAASAQAAGKMSVADKAEVTEFAAQKGNYIKRDGSVVFIGNANMNGNSIVGIGASAVDDAAVRRDEVYGQLHAPTGTKVLFYQAAAPAGWVKDTDLNDRAVIVTSGTGGTTGGSWSISGLASVGHTHNISSHKHEVPASNDNGSVQGILPSAWPWGLSGISRSFQTIARQSLLSRETLLSGPSGTLTTGLQDNTGISSDGSWRPSFVHVIKCTRQN